MQLDSLLFARDDCVTCGDIPPCDCSADQECVQISRSCTQCTTNTCVSISAGSSGSGGKSIGAGAVAGAVVGSVLFLACAVGFYFWWRKRQRRAENNEPVTKQAKDAPAPADTVLSRPDPIEKTVPHASSSAQQQQQQEVQPTVRVYDNNSGSVIDLDPDSTRNAMRLTGGEVPHNHIRDSNPFGDSHSIQTTSTGTQSTNVIPIALVPPGSVGSRMSSHSQSESSFSLPSRPTRSPGLDLEHLNVSQDTMPSNMAQELSVGSGITRHSYMSGASGASYASDVLEVPIIVTQAQRQVLGAVKAEAVHAPASSVNSLKTASVSSRPPVRSPLAASAFGPSDAVSETDERRSVATQELAIPNTNPFDDANSLPPPTTSGHRTSAATFGSDSDGGSLWTPLPTFSNTANGQTKAARPTSLDTQAASIIGADIRDVTRVHLGFVQPSSASFIPATPLSSSAFTGGTQTTRTAYRMTSGRLVTPTTGGAPSPGESEKDSLLEAQQARALAQARAAKAQAIEDRETARMSMSTVASNGGDSILASFPFVPPSPISNRPARTPPRSPLAAIPSHSTAQQTTNSLAATQPQTLSQMVDEEEAAIESSLSHGIVPPSRKTLGMSTGSQMSAMSTGLGSFPFQIEGSSDDHTEESNRPNDAVADAAMDSGAHRASSVAERHRASLDTLALTADLSSYPLGFDGK